jgi:hypothetical protein
MNGNLVGATAPAPELQKVDYYHRHARRAYRRGYYGGYYGGYNPGYYGGYYRRYEQCSAGSLTVIAPRRCTGPAFCLGAHGRAT